MSFPDFLIENGWKCHRKEFLNKEWCYIPCEFNNDYSSAINGKLDFRFLKDDREIIWGLNEFRKPPTLIYPRPKILWEKDTQIVMDDTMNRWLLNKTNEEILTTIL